MTSQRSLTNAKFFVVVVVFAILMGFSFGQEEPLDEFYGTLIELEPQTINAGQQILELDIRLPEGYQFNDIAPFSMIWQSDTDIVQFADDAELTMVEPTFPMLISLDLKEGQTRLQGDVNVYFCEYESLGICLFEEVRFDMPIQVTDDADGAMLMAHYDVPEPEGLNNF